MGKSISTTSKANQTPNQPANAQAINGLNRAGLSMGKPNQRKVIDLTSPNDTEVILIPATMLADIACDINNAAIVISDIGQLLGLIHYEKIDNHTARSMARLAHDATETWYDLLQTQVDQINQNLSSTRFGKGGA